jgi:Family of unknown function (DUF5706)
MTDPVERLRVAQWIFDKNLQWIAAADTKTGVLVAIDIGMLGALAATFSGTPTLQRTVPVILFTVGAAVMLGIGIFCAAMALFPRTQGPRSPYIFFGGIIEKQLADFSDSLRQATSDQLLQDCLTQIHRNAQIAKAKFDWIRRGMIWSFFGLMPWIAALACLKE